MHHLRIPLNSTIPSTGGEHRMVFLLWDLLEASISSRPDRSFFSVRSVFDKVDKACDIFAWVLVSRNFRNEPAELAIVGIAFDIQGSESILLGRCASFAPYFELDENNRLVTFTLGKHPYTIQAFENSEGNFISYKANSLHLGFRDHGEMAKFFFLKRKQKYIK